MKFAQSLLFCIAITALMGSCGLVADRQDSKTDSVPAPLAQLPDTAMASVEGLDYDIEIVDSTDNGLLELTVESAYDTVPGTFTFRGGTRRDFPVSGQVKGTPSSITVDWEFDTYEDLSPTPLGTWGGGTGWTGQPVYVEWTAQQTDSIRRTHKGILPNFGPREIMFGSLCSRVYFLNFDTGKESREYIDVTNPIKGTVSLDPALNGSLYVGQGVPRSRPFGHLAINLPEHKVRYMWPEDRKASRHWGAYDSSPVVVGKYLFWPGENGTVYKYNRLGNGQLKMHSCLRFKAKTERASAGMEASMCVYRNYGYVGDNHGNIVCINLNVMKPVWFYTLGDDIDGSLVLEVENGVPYIYAGCEVDRQGESGISNLVRLNGLDGSEVWKRSIQCSKLHLNNKHFDGGLYCTPLLGHGNCEGMMFLSICQPGVSRAAEFLALDRHTGNTIYSVQLKAWAWSSPVPFYNEKEELFIMTGDSNGNAYLIQGDTGAILFTRHMANNFESSPVVVGNHLVVGSRGKQIYRFSIN